jgi:hypothetical protein
MNSREKFNKNNPIVSVRLPVVTRDKLRAKLEKRGLTLKELLTGFADGHDSNLDS